MKSKFIIIKTFIFIFVFAIIFIRAWNISYDDPSGRSFLNGDGYSDGNTLSAVRYFHDYGFFESKWRPMHNYDGKSENKSTAIAYTHYPALPDNIIGFESVIFNTTKESVLRLLPIAISMVWFFLIYWLLGVLIPDREIAFLSASILVLSSYFIMWADTLHKHTFEEFFKWIYIAALYFYFQKKKTGKDSIFVIFALAIFAVLIANTSFDVIPFLAVTTVGFSFVYEKSWRKILGPVNVVLGLGFIAGFVLHMYLNSLYYGSWTAALQDLRESFLQRSGQTQDVGFEMHFLDYVELPNSAINRLERYFLIPGFAFIYFAWLGLKKIKSESKEKYGVAITLACASAAWYFVMPQHARVHHFTGKQIGIFYGLVIGYGLLEYKDFLRKRWQDIGLQYKVLNFIFIFYIVSMLLTQQVYQLWWQQGWARLLM